MSTSSKIAELEDGIRLARNAIASRNHPAEALAEYGAQSFFNAGTNVFAWFGVRATATQDATAALHAWMRAARRQIAKLEAA